MKRTIASLIAGGLVLFGTNAAWAQTTSQKNGASVKGKVTQDATAQQETGVTSDSTPQESRVTSDSTPQERATTDGTGTKESAPEKREAHKPEPQKSAPSSTPQQKKAEQKDTSSKTAGKKPASSETGSQESPQETSPQKNAPVTTGNHSEIDDSQNSDDIVVVGRRSEVNAFASERSVSVVERSKMEEMLPRTTPEALWDSSGIFVQETNFGGGAPIIRGMVGPQILLVYDGVRLNNSVYRTGPNQYLTLVDPFYISKMEVLRGAGSVLYGSDAMGGVIYMHGPSRPDLSGARFSARTGSAALEKTVNGAFTMAAEKGAVYFGSAIHSYSDLRAGRDVGVQPLSGYDVYSAAAKGWMDLPLDVKLTVGLLYTDIEGAGRTDKLWTKAKYQEYDNTETMMYARLARYFGIWNVSLTSSFQDFYENKRTYGMDLDTLTKLSMKSDETRVYTMGHDLSVRGALGESLSLVGGALWYHDFVHSNRYTSSDMMEWVESDVTDYPDGSTYDRYGAFGYLVWDAARFMGGTLRTTAGWRLQGVSAHSPARAGLDETDFSFFGNTFHASVQHIVQKRTNIGLVFSQGFRAPNLQESVMLGDAGKYFHVPNDDLEPEKMHSLEAFARIRRGRVQASVTGYVSYIDGILKREHTEWEGMTEIDGKPVVHHVNGDHAILTGVEAQASAYLGRGVSLRANTTYTRGTEYKDDGDVPLSKIPPLFGYVGLRKTALVLGGLGYAETYVRWATKQDRLSPSDMEDPRIPEGGTPGWWTWNIRMGYRTDDVMVSLVVENLLDKTYKYHGSGVYAPGTNALLQFTWTSF